MQTVEFTIKMKYIRVFCFSACHLNYDLQNDHHIIISIYISIYIYIYLYLYLYIHVYTYIYIYLIYYINTYIHAYIIFTFIYNNNNISKKGGHLHSDTPVAVSLIIV